MERQLGDSLSLSAQIGQQKVCGMTQQSVHACMHAALDLYSIVTSSSQHVRSSRRCMPRTTALQLDPACKLQLIVSHLQDSDPCSECLSCLRAHVHTETTIQGTHVVAARDEEGAQVAAHEASAAGDQHAVALHPRLGFGLRLAVAIRLCSACDSGPRAFTL